MDEKEVRIPDSQERDQASSVGVVAGSITRQPAVGCRIGTACAATRGDGHQEFLLYYPIVRDYLRRFQSCVVSADDLVQVTYSKAFRGLENGSVPRDKRAWLFSIARHVGYDQIRRDQRHPAVALDDRLECMLYEESVSEPIETIVDQEQKARLRRALDSLKREEQLFVHAYYGPDRHLFNPVVQFGISGELAKVRMYRIRKKLRRLLME